MKVLFTGDRNARKEYIGWVKDILLQIKERGGEVIVGDCPTGVDHLVAVWCEGFEIPCTVVKADWQMVGKAAGPQRNAKMVAMKPNICIAVHLDYANSRGTKDCAKKAMKAGITTAIVPRNIPFDFDDYEELKRYGRITAG